MFVDEGLELLTDGDCWDLLRRERVGRVGVTVGALPAIFPVNYAVVGGAIAFRTSPGTKLSAAAEGNVVAFEADSYDDEPRGGWSVLAIGRSEVVSDLDDDFPSLAGSLDSYARGRSAWIVRVVPAMLSGRRIVHEG